MDCDPHLDAALMPPSAPTPFCSVSPKTLVERLLIKIDRAVDASPASGAAYVETLIRSVPLETANDLVAVLPAEHRVKAAKTLAAITQLKAQRSRRERAAQKAKASQPAKITVTNPADVAFRKALHDEPDLDPEWQPYSTTGPRLLNVQALTSRGWAPRMIIDLLGKPDGVMPGRERLGRPKDWTFLLERVVAAEGLASFKAGQDVARARLKAARLGMKRQRERLNTEMDSEPIVIPIMPLATLRRLAFAHLNQHRAEMGGSKKPLDSKWIEASHQKRIIVNYVRHYLTPYDACLGRCIGRVGRHDAGLRIKTRVLKEIASAYPALADECAKQRNRVDRQDTFNIEDELLGTEPSTIEEGSPPDFATHLTEAQSLEHT